MPEQINVRKIKMPKVQRDLEFRPSSFDKEKRTVDVVFTSGSRVKRVDWWSGETFYEELDVSEKAIRLDRLNKGAPFLKDHRNSVESIIGVMGNARIENGLGIATVRFSKSQEAERYMTDIADGIIRNVSVGYRIHKVEETKDTETNVRTLRALDWEPLEVSAVGIPADDVAQSRSTNDEFFDVQLSSTEGEVMPPVIETKPVQTGDTGERTQPATTQVDVAAVRAEAAAAERTRAVEIRTACKAAKLDEAFAEKMIADGVTADAARQAVLAELGKRDEATKTVSTNVISVGDDKRESVRKEAMAEALLHRNNSKQNELSERAREYRRFSLIEMARISLEAKGVNTRGMNAEDISKRAFHTTSDFPEILANVQNKSLRDAYQQAPKTYLPFVRMTTVSDFKQISRTQLGDAPSLKLVGESGEFTHGTVSEAAEKYQLKTYGRVVPITRQALVNDDLGAFTRLTEMFGRRAADLESDLIWKIITDNAAMADSIALFHASHGNLGSGVINITNISAGRTAMRKQTGLDGQKINVRPAHLVVPAALEALAEQYVGQNTPDASSNVNPYNSQGSTPLKVVAEPRLDDVSAVIWFLFSDVGAIDMLEMAHLTGAEGPVIESEMGFDVDGMKLKCRLDVGAKAIDWRGMYKSTGV